MISRPDTKEHPGGYDIQNRDVGYKKYRSLILFSQNYLSFNILYLLPM